MSHSIAHLGERRTGFWLTSLFLVLAGCSSGGLESGNGSTTLVFDGTQVQNGFVGEAYSLTLATTGGVPPYAYEVAAGELPVGLTLSSAGTIQGTPSAAGLFTATIAVQDSGDPVGVGGGEINILVEAPGAAFSVLSNQFSVATEGDPYSDRFYVTGGQPPYTFEVAGGSLPPGLSLDASSGEVAGTPSVGGSFEFRVQAADSNAIPETETREMSISVASTPGTSLVPTVDLTADQVSGVAPLGVVFDATGTQMAGVTRPFHELEYHWSFADEWSSHRHSTGAIATHVFERAGTYDVRLTVTGAGRAVATGELTITVTDPDAFYAGENTICVSSSGNFAGAPVGSLHLSTSSFDIAAAQVGAGKRVLFRRGETFTCMNPPTIDVSGDSQLGAFGIGTDPDERGIFQNNPVINSTVTNTPVFLRGEGMRLTDLHFTGQTDAVVDTAHRVSRFLCHRVSSDGADLPLVFNHFVPQYWGVGMHSSIVIANNRHVNMQKNALFAGAEWFGLVDNLFANCADSHLLRITFTRKMAMDGNVVSRPAQIRHALKLHAQQDIGQYGRYTEQIVIRDNLFEGNADWLVALAPQNSISDEALRTLLFERNTIICEGQAQVGVYTTSADTTIRNNVIRCEGTTAWGYRGILVTRRGVEPTPEQVEVRHNTLYSAQNSNSSTMLVDIEQHLGSAVVSNNLMFCSNGAAQLLEGSALGSGNLLTATPNFANPSIGDLSLGASSPAIGAGEPGPVFSDLSGAPRFTWDSGAFTRN